MKIKSFVLLTVMLTLCAVLFWSEPRVAGNCKAVDRNLQFADCFGCAKTGRDHGSCEFCRGYEDVYRRTHDEEGKLIGYINEQGVLVLLESVQ